MKRNLSGSLLSNSTDEHSNKMEENKNKKQTAENFHLLQEKSIQGLYQDRLAYYLMPIPIRKT
jgi:hypothetical protein